MNVYLTLLILGTVLQTGQANQAPEFKKYMNNVELLEDTEPGKVVYTLSGSDPDNDPVLYGVYGDVFYVDKYSGEVTLKRRLDFERTQSLSVTFTITDRVNLVTKTATITIKDVNDVKPSFVKSTYFREINETFAVGGVVIKDISVTDPEGVNGLIKVTCEPGSAYAEDCDTFRVVTLGKFSSNDWHGQLVLNKKLNYEKKKNYQVPLVAYDGLNKQTKSVEIRVIDVPDIPPYFVRALSVSVREEERIGTIITQVSAKDGDKFSPRPLRYSIYNDANKLFAINDISGEISIAKRLDREGSLLSLGYSDIYLKVREVINKNPLQLGDSATTTATTTIRVSIMDINDNKPVFTSTYNVSIPEDIPNNMGIPNLLMTVKDKDTDTNANYIFSIDNYADRFYIHPAFGEGISTSTIRIKNTSLIDYEAGPKVYRLQVTAREVNSTERYSGTTTVTIYVTDVNDNAPVPDRQVYVASVNEQARAGLVLTRIRATDTDSGEFGTNGIRYERPRGMFEQLFNVDSVTGQVSVAPCATPGIYPCLDYEFRKQINLTVEIVDNNNAPSNVQRTLVELIINVVDANDNKPTFPNANYYGKIAEGSSEPSPEVIVKAEDVDMTSGQVRYSLINPEVPGLFQIGLNTGKITATRPVRMTDAGSDSYITMDVIASDGDFSAKASVRIEVLDRNNNKPIFQQKSYRKCIPENFPGGTFVIRTFATDADKPNTSNSKLSYVIATGAEGQFTIDQSGNIKSSFQARFDYEKKKSYVFQVVARDNGSPQLSDAVTVNICIEDINDIPPYFIPFTMQESIKEDRPVGSSVIKLKSVDADTNSNLEFRFVGPYSAINPNGVPVDRNQYDYKSLFSLDSTTGLIRVAKTLNRDKASLITLTLNVIDLNGVTPQTGTGTLIINIQDVNKIAPVFSPPWTKARPFYDVTLNEEQSVGSFVTILNAIDEDGAIEGYRLGDTNGYFAITNGVVTVRKRIDFEKVERLSFTAYAWDNVAPRMTATATVNVEIKNINDNSPAFKTIYQPTINENSPVGTRVVTVSATDIDKGDYGNIRYEIADPQSAFQINPLTGEITVKNSSVLDRERVKQIVLPVTAYDSPQDASVRLNTTVPVYIELKDENDNPPVFEKRSYYETVVESIPVGSRVIDISARDRDDGKNAIIKYVKASGDTSDLFNVSPNGAISVNKNLLNKIGNQTFQVMAVNSQFKDTAVVTIEVLKGASLPPKWVIPPTDNFNITVLESQYLGMFVYHVKAQDPDQGPSGLVSYSFLVDQAITQKTNDFMINSVTGVIRAERVFDREEKDLYNLILIARDHSKNPQNIARRLRVQILDVNDNRPQFPVLNGNDDPYTFEVLEGTTVGSRIGTVVASDKDLRPTVFYHILSGNEDGVFRLDKSTGILYLEKQIDREKISSYILNVEAVNNITDFTVVRPRNRRGADNSVTTVTILVKDRNDEKPQFTQKEYYGCISTEDSLMKSIVKVEAIDKDAPGGSVIAYSISDIKKNGIDTTAQKTFLIGEPDGIVRNTEIMSQYEDAVFTMSVIANDTAKGGQSDNANIKVFVTQKNEAVKVVLTQPSTDVYFFIDQIKQLISEKTGNSYVCVADIKDHMFVNGQMSKYWSDLFVYIINRDNNQVLLAKESAELLNSAKAAEEPAFSGLYVNKIQVAEKSEVDKERIPLLIIMILVILFIILALLLTCIACWCIARSKRKRIKKATYAKNLMISESEKNPVYSNRAFVADNAIYATDGHHNKNLVYNSAYVADDAVFAAEDHHINNLVYNNSAFVADDAIYEAEDHHDVLYNNVTETIEQVEMVDSPLYSTVEKTQPEIFILPDPDPPLGPEPVLEIPLDDPDFDDPAIYSVPERETIGFSHSVSDLETMPVIVSPLMDAEPVIETEPMDVAVAGGMGVVGSSGEELSGAYSRPSSAMMHSMHSSSGPASQRSSSRGLSRQASSALPSVHSSSGVPSIRASMRSGEHGMESVPVIVTSPVEPESPTEALQQMDAVFANELAYSPPPVIVSQMDPDVYEYRELL